MDDSWAKITRWIDGISGGSAEAEADAQYHQCHRECVERTDRFVSARGEMVFPVTGVFVVEDGKVVYWKDYLFPGKKSIMPS